ncbi:MAG: ATP-binding protein [Spirochaetes bacterium]|nr:MAG: ATP-binding protein [Spirochaetota bacterium]
MKNYKIDPRISLINDRIKKIKNIIPVISSKGGVGKSLVSSALAWGLREYANTALLDLDFWGASDHLLLDAFKYIDGFPEEDRGILPVDIEGLKFMSVIYYTQNKPLSLRGIEFSDAFIEIMSATRWENLDYLIIDMPPGLNDPLLDVLKFFRNGKFVVVATPSKLAVNVVKKTIEFVKEQKYRILGLIENMVMDGKSTLRDIADTYGIELIGSIPYFNDLERELEDSNKLKEGRFFKKVSEMSKYLLEQSK